MTNLEQVNVALAEATSDDKNNLKKHRLQKAVAAVALGAGLASGFMAGEATKDLKADQSAAHLYTVEGDTQHAAEANRRVEDDKATINKDLAGMLGGVVAGTAIGALSSGGESKRKDA